MSRLWTSAFVLCFFAAGGWAQTTQPSWITTDDGQLVLRPFAGAPYPHASREQGFKGSSAFFPKAGHYDDSTVGIFIPKNYTPGERVDFVVHFHGHRNEVATAIKTFRLTQQLAASGVNSILIVPQGPKDAADSGCGKLELDNGGMKALLDEVTLFLQTEGKVRSREIGSVVLSAHSGGYKVTAAILDHGGLESNITDVLLLDASYGSLDRFAAWCAGGKDRRLVSLFTDHLKDENQELMKLLDQSKVIYERIDDEKNATDEAFSIRRALFIPTTLPHNDVPMKSDYFRRLLATSSLRSR